jgi:hypothetical protein
MTESQSGITAADADIPEPIEECDSREAALNFRLLQVLRLNLAG